MMVDADVDEAAEELFETPDDLHAARRVQRRLSVVKVQLPMFGVYSVLRNPPDLYPRADTRHSDEPA
jgi:hypothetical protein